MIPITAKGAIANGDPSASATSIGASNYKWWHSLAVDAKESAIRGAIIGITGEWIDAYRQARTDAENALDNARASGRIPRAAATVVASGRYPATPQFGKSIGFYRRAIDAFYAKNPLARKANIFVVLMCLSDRPTEPCATISRDHANL